MAGIPGQFPRLFSGVGLPCRLASCRRQLDRRDDAALDRGRDRRGRARRLVRLALRNRLDRRRGGKRAVDDALWSAHANEPCRRIVRSRLRPQRGQPEHAAGSGRPRLAGAGRRWPGCNGFRRCRCPVPARYIGPRHGRRVHDLGCLCLSGAAGRRGLRRIRDLALGIRLLRHSGFRPSGVDRFATCRKRGGQNRRKNWVSAATTRGSVSRGHSGCLRRRRDRSRADHELRRRRPDLPCRLSLVG